MNQGIDYDGAWKETLDVYLRPFLEFCFPQAAGQVDWSAPPEPLDKELQKIVRDAQLGKQRVDKLVKVRRLNGAEEWVLVHIELQAQTDRDLPQRVYRYHHRIVDRFNRRAATLVVFADDRPGWRPDLYEEELWGCRVQFTYPICKLLDFSRDSETLEASSNPAAVVIAAHLAAKASRGNMELRKRSKWQLVRRLYDRGYNHHDVQELLRLIDWLLVLPEAMEQTFEQELIEFESENTMAHITSFERIGIQKGRHQGAADLTVRQARKRFPEFSPEDEAAIRKLSLVRLEELSEALLDFAGIADLRNWLSKE
jgi:hypothetical protein